MTKFFNKLDKGSYYLLGLIITLLLMVLLPNISSFGLFGYIAKNDPENYHFLLDQESEFYSIIMNNAIFICQACGYVAFIGIVVVLYSTIFKEDAISFKNNLLRNIAIIILGFLLMYGLTWLMSFLFDLWNIPTSSNNQDTIEGAIASGIFPYVAITVVLLAPFVEEVIFRKMLFGVSEEKLKWPKVVSIILSTLIFSLIHVTTEIGMFFSDPHNAIYLLSIFLYIPLAFVLSLSYSLSKNNFYVTFIIHLLNNLISLLAILGVI